MMTCTCSPSSMAAIRRAFHVSTGTAREVLWSVPTGVDCLRGMVSTQLDGCIARKLYHHLERVKRKVTGHNIFLEPFTALTTLRESLAGLGSLQKWLDPGPFPRYALAN